MCKLSQACASGQHNRNKVVGRVAVGNQVRALPAPRLVRWESRQSRNTKIAAATIERMVICSVHGGGTGSAASSGVWSKSELPLSSGECFSTSDIKDAVDLSEVRVLADCRVGSFGVSMYHCDEALGHQIEAAVR